MSIPTNTKIRLSCCNGVRKVGISEKIKAIKVPEIERISQKLKDLNAILMKNKEN
ncbi:16130_t:CDS:2, partial [Racocetra persica]